MVMFNSQSQRVDDGHDPHVQVAAVDVQHLVAHNLHQGVGDAGEEAGQPQADNAPQVVPLGA